MAGSNELLIFVKRQSKSGKVDIHG